MSLRACVLSLLYIFGLRNGAKRLILTPSEEAAVLCEGEELELICTTNETFLQWSWSLQTEHGKVIEYSRFISSTDASQQIDSFSVNGTSFLISRVSHQGKLPLVSRLLVSSVSLKVNAVTIANCTEVGADGMASITINMVGNINANYPNLPEVNSSVIEYGILDITVHLQWIPQNDVIYNISINPKVAIVDLMTTPGVQFSVSYNIHYEVSIVATSSCGQNRTVVSLHYAACDYPLQEGNSDANYTRPVLEGTSVMFDCPPGLELAGSESATCMENGEWEPNITCSRPTCPHPAEQVEGSVSVIGYKEPALRGTNATLACPAGLILTPESTLTCVGNGEWEPDPNTVKCKNERKGSLSNEAKIAVASSVTVFTVASILFFIIGFLCGHFCQKRRKSSTTAAAGETVPPGGSGGHTQTPYYDDVVLQQKFEVELKKNAAYGPLQ